MENGTTWRGSTTKPNIRCMVGVPSYDQLFNPTLRALRELGGSASITELSDRVINNLDLPVEVAERPHTGNRNQTELEYRLAWARTYLKKYGLLHNSERGVWALTPVGTKSRRWNRWL